MPKIKELKKEEVKVNYSLEKEIKKKEDEKRKKVILPAKAKVSFDAWYHSRLSKIPKHHLKEIIFADFKARGLSKEDLVEKYDKALEKYGIKLS